MEFKLFNRLLEAVYEAQGVDKRRHMFNVEDEHGNVYPHKDIQFDKYNTKEDALDVYGDKSVVIKYKAHNMVWHNHKKDEGFEHGINTMDIESISLNGKPIFSAQNGTLPNEVLAKWHGHPEDVADMTPGVEQVLHDYKEEGNVEAINTYLSVIRAKPSLWGDIGKALLAKYEELDDR